MSIDAQISARFQFLLHEKGNQFKLVALKRT